MDIAKAGSLIFLKLDKRLLVGHEVPEFLVERVYHREHAICTCVNASVSSDERRKGNASLFCSASQRYFAVRPEAAVEAVNRDHN